MARFDRRRAAAAAALVLAAATLGVRPIAAQDGGVWATEEHQCEDCHGAHTDGRGRSALVRSGMSQVSPQAPGINEHSARCLQCHGTESDRRLVMPDGEIPQIGAVLLGANLGDDHVLGSFALAGTLSRVGGLDPVRTAGGEVAILRPDLDPSGVVNCGSCHDAHATWLITQQSQLQDDVCLGCHDEGLDLGAHGVAGCGGCHRMHGSSGAEDLLREARPDHLCGACHDGAPRPSSSGIEPIPAQRLHAEPTDSRCGECHTIH